MLNPGKLKHRVTFQLYNGTVDQYGDVRNDLDSNWTDFRRVSASVEPLSGREFYAAEQSQSEVTHKIRCRYFRGAKAEMRIVYGTRKFKIISIIDWREAHEEFLIMAKELVE